MFSIYYVVDDVITTVIFKKMNKKDLDWVKENIHYEDKKNKKEYFNHDELKDVNLRLFVNFIIFCENKGKNLYDFLKLYDRETFYNLVDLIDEFSEGIVDKEEMALILNENLDIVSEYCNDEEFNFVVDFIRKNMKQNK